MAPELNRIPSSVRARVESVYTIVGEGCVLACRIEEGTVRPPVKLRWERVGSSPGTGVIVEVVKTTAHRKVVAEVSAGTLVGLTIRGLVGTNIFGRRYGRDWPVAKDDLLVSP